MSSLINNAMSGLNAAQAALNTASNNISSYNVAGYTRQTTIMAQANSTLGAGGWVGNGVYVSGVQREYDAFITNQLRAAQTQSSGLTARYEQMSKIDNMLSTSTSSLATQMQDFFTSLQTLVSNAEDPAARQALIGKSEGLVNQFKTTDQYLRDQDKQVNIAIGASVDQINNYAKQIASLKLGQLALAFAEAFNTQHKAGFDANGDAGEDFFAIGKPAVLQNTKNKGDVAIGATVTDASAVLATDYKISFDNNQWQVTRLASNTTFTVTPDANGKVAFDGLELTFTGTPAVNDSFTLKPVSDAIVNMDVLITDEAKIAMASEEDAGDSDNRNGQALLDLQSNSKTVGGAKSFNDAYASLVSDIGNKTATLKTSSATQGNVVTQLSNQQQSISGVNLDEEYGNLQRFQQYYLANAQVLQTANAIFDALINIR
ncbi:flagellar hook-associated protein FlgK [Escherichia coli]|uniref:FlgK family flagellar hook-associated protein n=1 Tax=Escherichia coli TaxID=562 RepID=UPI0014823429|nr:flagellar basal body rod C-terminal domain-containing protein [Escherichia coli]NNQ64686.1 flagellar hook-associated protein FlgK [Escherichia coli]